MRVLTKQKIRHIEAGVRTAREHARYVNQLKQDAKIESNKQVVPTRDELVLLHDMLNELREWNTITFEHAKHIDELEAERHKDLPQLNQIKKRNERANRKAHEIKKRLNRNLNQYILFCVPIPKDRYGEIEYVTYKYKNVNEDIQKIINAVSGAYSEGEQLVKNLDNL